MILLAVVLPFVSALLGGLAAFGLVAPGLAAAPLVTAAQEPSTLSIAWDPPAGVQDSGTCTPGEGERWAGPESEIHSETGVRGPLYLVYHGRLIAVQYEVSQADLVARKSWTGISIEYWGQPLPIDHEEIRPFPAHPGFEEPHYGVYVYLVNQAEQDAIDCQPQ